MVKDLVKIIRENPGCVATIDNDGWVLAKDAQPPDDFESWTWQRQDEWREAQRLASSDERFKTFKNETYQEEHCYGGAILLALAEIVGIKVESV